MNEDFQSGFDVKRTAPERFADAVAGRWSTVVERDRSGKPKQIDVSINCNQEPCYEELQVQRLRGVPSAQLREKAIEARRALAGGFDGPIQPHIVRQAVLEACEIWDAHMKSQPAKEFSDLFRGIVKGAR